MSNSADAARKIAEPSAKEAVRRVLDTVKAEKRTSLTAPDEKTELNRIILPKEGGQLSAGPDFHDLTHYQRCPAN